MFFICFLDSCNKLGNLGKFGYFIEILAFLTENRQKQHCLEKKIRRHFKKRRHVIFSRPLFHQKGKVFKSKTILLHFYKPRFTQESSILKKSTRFEGCQLNRKKNWANGWMLFKITYEAFWPHCLKNLFKASLC